MKKTILFAGLFLLISCRTGVIAADDDSLRDLFGTDDQLKARYTAKLTDPTIIRSRTVRVDFDLLKSLKLRHAKTFRFNLFDDLFFGAVVEKINERLPNSYTCFGRLTGDSVGNFSFAVEKEVMIANIRPRAGRLYQVRFLGDLQHEVRECDQSKFPKCGVGPEDIIHSEADYYFDTVEDAVQSEGDDGSIFDVLVVYTADARNGAGGTDAMNALINIAVLETNIAYENSQVHARLRLACKEEIDYVESDDSRTDLNRLRGNGDNHMDSVHDLRNANGADMVCLIVENLDSSCGIAPVMTALSSGFESDAFSVVKRSCATGNYTFGHELGHNMGCHHAVGDGDPPAARGNGLYDYSHGWRWTGDSSVQHRSIMAYAPGTRVIHFSNPNVSFDGQPTGQSNFEDNARSINNAASTVANWRQSIDPHTLTISSTSGGSVTEPGEGQFQCCPGGSAISIVAQPNTNYHFVEWTGTAVDADKVENPNAASTAVTMDADYTLVANFAINPRTLTISSTSGGSVTEPGEGSYHYDPGEVVEIAAEAEVDYHFVGWTGHIGNVDDPSDPNTTVTMDGSYTLVANFVRTIIHVDVSAPGPTHDGSSWTQAYLYLQDGLAAAGSGCNGVAIYGGFPAGGSTWEQRDPNMHETILTGDLNGDDGPNFANNGDNCYHVVNGSGTDANSILDGFTITAGNANGSSPDNSGGGMYNDNSSPTIKNCTFSGNSATICGGGMYNQSSSPAVTGCIFTGNSAADFGGGMGNYNSSSPTVTGCMFSSNSAANYGGGFFNDLNASPTLIDCEFTDNSAEYGGGMRNQRDSRPTLIGCTFSGNSAANSGGGMRNKDSSPSLTDCIFTANSATYGGAIANDNSSSTMISCTFSGNSADEWGGGVSNQTNSSPTLTNCTFSSNHADYGGGMLNDSSSPTVTNCTFTGNSADKYGGGIIEYQNSPIVTNCAFSGNRAVLDGGAMGLESTTALLTNCTFSGNSARDGNGIFCDSYPQSPSTVQLANCILWDGGDEIRNNDGSTITITYSCVQDENPNDASRCLWTPTAPMV
jgi:hypothetical protein